MPECMCGRVWNVYEWECVMSVYECMWISVYLYESVGMCVIV